MFLPYCAYMYSTNAMNQLCVESNTLTLRAAYEDLDDERWSGEEFVKLMVTDGCFLLEVMRAFQLQQEGKKKVEEGGDYEAGDPVFSEHGYLYLRCDIISDVLVMENQVPLLLLDKLCHVAYADNLQESVSRWPPPAPPMLVVDLQGRSPSEAAC
uniref:Uncharacterized protein n=1 Tax=Oryza nivara TaxID=4536 RepID=A0A0E0J2R3_ORYNI